MEKRTATAALQTALIAVVLCCCVPAGAARSFADGFTSTLANRRLWSGMVLTATGGKTLFSKGYGLASHELGVPMRDDHLYPIGSNTKLFTAVAVWQLHAQGKLNAYDDVAKYLDAKELGLNGTWCPKVYKQTDGKCQAVKIMHMLSMQSGVMGTDNCAYPPGAWQQDYCFINKGSKRPNLDFEDVHNMELGAWGVAEYVRRVNFLTNPLEFAPGTGYHYSNAGFAIAAYIVEKVSGKDLKQYFQEHIFGPAGLYNTYYDLSNGQDGVYAGLLPYPSYQAWFSPISGNMPSPDQAVVGLNASLNSGNVPPANPAEGPPYGLYVKTSRNMNALGIGFADYTIGGAAGAIISTQADMLKWFRTLTTTPEVLGLRTDLVKEMFTTGILTPQGRQRNLDLIYAQGIVSLRDKSSPRGVSQLSYLGSLAGFEAFIYLDIHPTDANKDTFTAVLGATNTPVEYYDLTGDFNVPGSCKYNGKPVLQALCDAKYNFPTPGMAPLIGAKVASEETHTIFTLPM